MGYKQVASNYAYTGYVFNYNINKEPDVALCWDLTLFFAWVTGRVTRVTDRKKVPKIIVKLNKEQSVLKYTDTGLLFRKQKIRKKW